MVDWLRDPGAWLAPPLPAAQLERLRLSLRKSAPKSGLGAHLHRRKGQAMEFREHRAYSFGDDVRKVDWAASARHGLEHQLLVREFEAEERRTAVILLDLRPAMMLPEAIPKALVAAWLAQSLAAIALKEGDRVEIVPLFRTGQRAMTLKQPAQLSVLRSFLLAALSAPLSDTEWDTLPEPGALLGAIRLPPASVITLISDMLWEDPTEQLVSFMRRAQASYRSAHVLEIDSWPHEKALMQAGPFRLGGLERRVFPAAMFEAPDRLVSETQTVLAAHLETKQRQLQAGSLVWPDRALRYPQNIGPLNAMRNWFAAAFSESEAVSALVSRSQ